MKTITLKELKDLNYSPKGVSNYKLIEGECSKCNQNFEYSNVKKFLRNRKSNQNKDEWDTCAKCYLKLKTIEDSKWMEANRQAQLIAQNRPEQKKRNAEGVSKSWDQERKSKASDFLKKRWENEEGFAEKALKNFEWTQTNDERHNEILKRSLGAGGLKGEYQGIRYDSAVELSFLLWCENKNIPIKRYDLAPISYLAEDGKTRLYFPDFIIYHNQIIEIKGLGVYYQKNYQRNLLKIDAAQKFCQNYKVIFSDDECLKKFYKKARKLHHETKK